METEINRTPSNPPKTKEILEREEHFHDEWADSISPSDVLVDESFECCTAPEGQQIMKWLGSIIGRDLLDLGAGAGEAAVYFAKQGANVTATDLSAGMLEVVKKVAEIHGVSVQTQPCSADTLPFLSNSFDIVHAANLLHHVDTEKTLKEVHRVLRPGGIFVSWDPLAHNPVINIYRRMAMGVRTVDEHPLRMKDLALFRKYFATVDYRCTWFTTLWIFLRFFLIERVHPNKERYWKKILIEHKRLESIHRPLSRIDNTILTLLPFLKRYCWNIVVCCRKAG